MAAVIRELDWPCTLGHNLAVIGALFASFRAGDNFGFHMADDQGQGQCTCQWTPSRGVPYRGWTPCVDDDHSVFDDDDDDDDVWTVDKPTEAA